MRNTATLRTAGETSQQRANRLLSEDQAQRALRRALPAPVRLHTPARCECDACEVDRHTRFAEACFTITRACVVAYVAIGVLLWAALFGVCWAA